MRFTSVIAASALAGPSIAGYAIQDDYSPENFFSMFNFFTDADPTNGKLDASPKREHSAHMFLQALSTMSILLLRTALA